MNNQPYQRVQNMGASVCWFLPMFCVFLPTILNRSPGDRQQSRAMQQTCIRHHAGCFASTQGGFKKDSVHSLRGAGGSFVVCQDGHEFYEAASAFT
jgi:hypothetical protein